jgi:glutamine synthetase type III
MASSIRQQAIVSVLSKHSKPAAGNEPGPFPWEATWARYTFTDDDLKKRVPSSSFKSYKKATSTYQPLEPQVADVVASALRDWAVERGCTHFCHWFQPIHIATAEKHECFLDLDHNSQRAILVRLFLPCPTFLPTFLLLSH